MKVLKFGGTSVGTVESLSNVKRIAEKLSGGDIMVVSALGGLTDKLIATAKMAASNDPAYRQEMEAIRQRHHHIIDALVEPGKQPEVRATVDDLLNSLARNYDGVALLNDLPARTLDQIVSMGERMSSVIVAAIIPNGRHFDSPSFIKTEKWYGKNIANVKLTDQLIREAFADLGPDTTAVCGGFISTDHETGEITNLGRGGSDYTAALIAASLDADVLEIWTDVNGFMTADPRIIPDAFVMDHLTFIESMQLCTFGAKVIYPPTIYPVFHKNIPIRILNTFNPEGEGTWIDDTPDSDRNPVKGLSALRRTALIKLSGKMADNHEDVASRTYNAMAKRGISSHTVTSLHDDSCGFAFGVAQDDLVEAMKVLIEEFSPELAEGELSAILPVINLATVACVGENIKRHEGLGARLLNTLERDNIRVMAMSEGSSATTITFIIEAQHTDEALRLLHASIFN